MPLVPNNGPGVTIPQTNQVVISTSIDVLVESRSIGFVQSVTPNNTRRGDRVRQLDAVDAGRTIEQAMGPEDHNLRISGFVAYADNSFQGGQVRTGTVLDRLLGAKPQVVGSVSNVIFTCLSSQAVPFDILVARKRPGVSSVIGRTAYKESWMVGNSEAISIGNITVAEEIQMQPTFIGN